jgi:hypothetical protein
MAHMFQPTEDRHEKGRSRMVMVLAGVVVVLVFGGILLYSGMFGGASQPQAGPPVQQGLPNALHKGDPAFDEYKDYVQLVNKKFYTQANMLGQNQAVVKGEISNFGDKNVIGVELRGKVIGKDGQVKAQVLASPVPKVYELVPAKKSVPFAITIDGAPNRDDIDDMTIEVEGLVIQP